MLILPNIIPYTGNKRTRMEQILALIPKNEAFIDLFGGSGVVGFNVAHNGLTNFLHYNEIRPQIHQLISKLTSPTFSENELVKIRMLDCSYPKTKEGYLTLRSDYNRTKSWRHLLLLICRSFSNDTRFNKKGEFNLPFGDRNSLYTSVIKNLELYMKRNRCNTILTNKDWKDVNVLPYSFVFVDPPYSITSATYNNGWSQEDDLELMRRMDHWTAQGTRWMMTNVVENRGNVNQELKDWIKRNGYRTELIEKSYGNCAGVKSKQPTKELIIMNY